MEYSSLNRYANEKDVQKNGKNGGGGDGWLLIFLAILFLAFVLAGNL